MTPSSLAMTISTSQIVNASSSRSQSRFSMAYPDPSSVGMMSLATRK